MTDNITHGQASPGRDSKPKFRDVLLGDLRRGDFNRTLRRDLQDLYPACRGISAGAAGALLLAEVDRFVGGGRPNDDLSLILVRRKPS